MSNWISSKLKVAETFLQQIDQQAAESLRKNEKLQLDELNHQIPTKIEPPAAPPLKDQLKKRNSTESNDFYSPPRKENVVTDKSRELLSPSATPTLTDSDWTQLLGTPEQLGPVSRKNGVLSKSNGVRKEAKKVLELKKGQRSQVNVSKTTRKSSIASDDRVNSGSKGSKRSDLEEAMKIEYDVGSENEKRGSREKEEFTKEESKQKSGSMTDTPTPVSIKVDERTDIDANWKSKEVIRSIVPPRDSIGGSSSSSDGTSSSGSDSSSSDSEKEREKQAERARRRERILAEEAAAKAVEVIKEHENIVARLEGEKQSLEKILEERAKQQAQEASELQMSMMETMDAVDLEKQKHNNTRMEAFARLTKLETTNADLAKSLATTQWNLEIESNQVAKLRQQIESKEAIQEDIRRRITKIQQRGSSNKVESSKGVEFEREILEAEYALTCDKILDLQEKETKLKENIEILQREINVPTEVEIELKRRLTQLTNHLIQKQSQVESLSSEKATLLFRIETVSRLLEEERTSESSITEDIEAGTWESSKNMSIRSGGQQHLGSLLRQLETIYCAGAAFIRRNPSGKIVAGFYIVCLHLWVLYILLASSGQSQGGGSGAVVSLESINKTTGP